MNKTPRGEFFTMWRFVLGTAKYTINTVNIDFIWVGTHFAIAILRLIKNYSNSKKTYAEDYSGDKANTDSLRSKGIGVQRA